VVGPQPETANRAIVLPPEVFANMMAFTYFTWEVISRDCVTSTWSSSQDNFFAYVLRYIG